MLLGLLLVANPAGAQEIVVIPAGSGAGLTPTAAVGRSIVQRFNKGGRKRARLVYMLPDFPPPKKGLTRKAERLMKQAAHSFQMMEYKKAMEQADEAAKIYKDIAKSNQLEGYVEAQHLTAAAAFFDGNNVRALTEMNDAYLASPRRPAKKRFSPQVQDLHTQVVSEPPPTGMVRVGSNPSGALLWFHGKLLGPARGTFRLRAGLYLVRAYLPGHVIFQRWFRVRAHQTRDLIIPLAKQDAPAESESMAQLREEARGEEPGATLNQIALDLGASQVVLLTSARGCTSKSCRITMRWAKEAKWSRQRSAVYSGNATLATAALLGKKPKTGPVAVGPSPGVITPIGPLGSRSCELDSQCDIKERCVQGRCEAPTPVYQKWWFWTLIGIGVAGATVGIVVPLTRPGAPVISVE